MKNLGYSQNFLVNKKLVERLISKSNIDVTDYVIEIGPGKGIITDVLSQHAGEVVAVEYDQELYNNLVRYHSHDNVTYIFGDFLKYKLPLNRRYKIFSNIPFQITADIIRKLTDDVNPPSDINIITINEQISNFAQTYPTNLKASSNEALLFMRRYRFANCSCFSCCFKDAYPSSNVQ